MKPIAVQMYSLRDEAKKDLKNVLKQVAEIGYKAIEPAGFYGLNAADFKKLTNSYGLEISSSHTPWAKPDNIQEVIDTAGLFGLDTACAGFGPKDFKDLDSIKRTADTVNAMAAQLAKAEIKLFLHNHAREFDQINGKIIHHYIAEMCPAVYFEIDTYWASNFGKVDVVEQLRYFGRRVILLHIKDGVLIKDAPNVAVGSGKMDFSAVINAADKQSIRWLIVEFDNCATDIFEAIKNSYLYLIRNKLGCGNR